jgi:hypothetical protein
MNSAVGDDAHKVSYNLSNAGQYRRWKYIMPLINI